MNPTLTKLRDARHAWEQLPVADKPHHAEPRACQDCYWFKAHRDANEYGNCAWHQRQTVAGGVCFAWRRNPHLFRETNKQPMFSKRYA